MNEIICMIPSHNQSSYFDDIIRGFENQTTSPSHIFFILDRCDDNSSKKLELLKQKTFLNIDYIEKNYGSKYSVSEVRNFGYKVYVDRYGEPENVLFLDGDCIPNKYVIEEHLENLNRIDAPIASSGRRESYNEWNKNIGDNRDIDYDQLLESKNRDIIFSNKNGKLLHSSLFHDVFIVIHGCNFAMNKKAINLCIDVNNELNPSSELQICNNRFNGNYAFEDNFIGSLLFHTYGYVFSCSTKSFVIHEYHKPSSYNCRGRKNFQKYRMLLSSLNELTMGGYTDNMISINKNNNMRLTDLFKNHNVINDSLELITESKIIRTNNIYESLIQKDNYNLNIKDEHLSNFLKVFFARNVDINMTMINGIKKELNYEEVRKYLRIILKHYITIKNKVVLFGGD